VAGLWSGYLIEGLAWQGLGNRAPASTTEYIGPTWSWASFAVITATSLDDEWRDVAEIKGWHVDLKHEENPYGEVNYAWIRIHGPLARLTPSKTGVTDHETRLDRAGITPLPRFCTKYSEDEEGCRVTLDYLEQSKSGEWRNWDTRVLILGGYRKEQKAQENKSKGRGQDGQTEMQSELASKSDDLRLCYGLVLCPIESGQAMMKRVGWMFIDVPEALKVIDDTAGWSTVTLL
jgi:hypothetical protein